MTESYSENEIVGRVSVRGVNYFFQCLNELSDFLDIMGEESGGSVSTYSKGVILRQTEIDMIASQVFAEQAHAGQKRKYVDEDYVEHPIRVRNILAELLDSKSEEMTKFFPSKKDIIIAAILHDTVEDCNVSLDVIQDKFGFYVRRLVSELTNKYTKDNYPELNRQTRKHLEAQRIRNISNEAKLIKLADRLDNVSGIQNSPKDFGKKYAQETLHLLTSLIGVNTVLYDKITKICEDYLNNIKTDK